MSATTPRPRLATATQVESSELSRNADVVFRAAGDRPVLITRPDSEPLLLISQANADEVDQVLAAAASLIGVVGSANLEIQATKLAVTFPWSAVLSDTERTQLVAELIEAAGAGLSLREHNLFLGTLNGWRATAEAHAAGIGRQPIEWLEGSNEVDDPPAS